MTRITVHRANAYVVRMLGDGRLLAGCETEEPLVFMTRYEAEHHRDHELGPLACEFAEIVPIE